MKLVICANRLPLTIKRTDKHKFSYSQTSGGLVTGIKSLAEKIKFTWYGNISGQIFDEIDKSVITEDAKEQFDSVPIFIDPELNDLCYDGFCNAILWPTIHSFPDNVCFTFKEYDAYKKYNRIFAEEILKDVEDGDIVWIHDYHLMLVSQIIKERKPNVKIMFFLHTAFCAPDHLRNLLCAEELLESLSKCDIVGFHTPQYATNFILSLKSYNIERIPEVRAVSIGIEPDMFREELKRDECKKFVEKYKNIFGDKKVILGVDRTDYIKGMPQRFKGIEVFLKRNEENAKNCLFLQVAIPSRQGVREYAGYVEQVNMQVEKINSTCGKINETAIKMIFGSVGFSELCALYSLADCILITSVTDGMNLVAMEYIACQDQKKGSVILSKFAGAACTLQGAILHNSNNTEKIADAIEKGLTIDQQHREINYEINKKAINDFTSMGWAAQSLKRVCENWEDLKK